MKRSAIICTVAILVAFQASAQTGDHIALERLSRVLA